MTREFLRSVPVWQVQHGQFWWDVPVETSKAIEKQRLEGRATAIYHYDWGYARPNNVRVDGDGDFSLSNISAYVIDFDTMVQCNIVSGRRRSVRCVWLHETQPPKKRSRI